MGKAGCIDLFELPDVLPPAFDTQAISGEIAEAGLDWTQHYSEYQSGAWWTCTLLGRSRRATDGEVTDTAGPVATDALERLPKIGKLLQGLGLHYMMVRLARLDPGGALWEHKDYQDLRDVARQRIHLPIETTPEAFMVTGGSKYHLAPETLWAFHPTKPHGSCNLGHCARIHLLIDAYEDQTMKTIFARAIPRISVQMTKLAPEALMERVKNLRQSHRATGEKADRGTGSSALMDWERSALLLYFQFSIPDGALYNALELVCAQAGDHKRATFWRGRRNMVLGDGLAHV